jgi:hypothetical protein
MWVCQRNIRDTSPTTSGIKLKRMEGDSLWTGSVSEADTPSYAESVVLESEPHFHLTSDGVGSFAEVIIKKCGSQIKR